MVTFISFLLSLSPFTLIISTNTPSNLIQQIIYNKISQISPKHSHIVYIFQNPNSNNPSNILFFHYFITVLLTLSHFCLLFTKYNMITHYLYFTNNLHHIIVKHALGHIHISTPFPPLTRNYYHYSLSLSPLNTPTKNNRLKLHAPLSTSNQNSCSNIHK